MKPGLKIIVVIILFLVFFLLIKFTPKHSEEPWLEPEDIDRYDHHRQLTLRFIEEKMSSSSKAVYTNFLPSENIKKYATGHEILSESEGLIMLCYVEAGDKEKFDWHFKFVRKRMISPAGGVKWRVSEDSLADSKISASIDDLRIIRALFKGYQLWGEIKYKNLYLKLEKALRNKCINGNYLVDFYDDNIPASVITLSYLDLYTKKILTSINNEWDNVYNSSVSIIGEGYIRDAFPMYYKQYELNKSSFVFNEHINLIDSLLTVLHLAEVKLHNEYSIEWLKSQMFRHGKLLCLYNLDSGEPCQSENYESTAVYAIAMRICMVTGDEELYKVLADRMLEFQVLNSNSEVYGGFADEHSLEVFSFDNLQAILGLRGNQKQ